MPAPDAPPSLGTDQRRATLNAVAAVLLWSTVASAFKLTLRHLRPAELLLWASAASAVSLTLLLAARGQLALLVRAPRRELCRRAALGLLNPLCYYLVLFWAYDLLPAQEAQPLNYTWAITLSLLAVPLLGQPLGWRQLGGMLLSVLGVLLIATRGAPWTLRFQSPLGVGLALGSTVLWALFWIGDRGSRLPATAGLALSFWASLPPCLLVLALGGELRLPPWPGLLGAIYVGLFEMGLTFVLWSRALRLAHSAARVSRLIFFSPFLSQIFIWLTVGEPLRWSALSGLALIVGGTVVGQRRAGGP